MSHPLLSICIPTYNRAELLRLQLMSLGEQIKDLGGQVELIISDNASTDSTAQVVEAMQQDVPARYHRNNENLGVIRNYLIVTNELATGEFCWILGDDDMVVKGKLAKVLDYIRSNSNIDYFFVNHFKKPIEERNYLIKQKDALYFPQPNECVCMDFSSYPVTRWEDLFDIPCLDPVGMFTAIVGHVFRRSAWLAKAPMLQANAPLYTSLDSTFPHIPILALAMIGKPVFYIGEPCVLLSIGSQEWSAYWWVSFVVHLGSAIDLYERLGVDSPKIRQLRGNHLRVYASLVPYLLFDSAIPGRRQFSLRRFLWTNRQHPWYLARLLVSMPRVWLFVRVIRPMGRLAKQRLPAFIRKALYPVARKVLRSVSGS